MVADSPLIQGDWYGDWLICHWQTYWQAFFYISVIEHRVIMYNERVWVFMHILLLTFTCFPLLCCQISNISHTKPKNLKVLISSCNCLCLIHWSQVLSWEWKWQVMLQLHLSDQQSYCPPRCFILEVWWYSHVYAVLFDITRCCFKHIANNPHMLPSTFTQFVWKLWSLSKHYKHYNDVIMGTMVSQITSLTIVYSIIYSGADQKKKQSSTSLAFVRGIHRWPVNSPHKGPVTRKVFPFDDLIMRDCCFHYKAI